LSVGVESKAEKASTPTLEEIELEEDTRHLEAFLADTGENEEEEFPPLPFISTTRGTSNKNPPVPSPATVGG